MVLKARAACRTSRGPSSGSGGRSRSWPSASAASDSSCSGRTTQRTATIGQRQHRRQQHAQREHQPPGQRLGRVAAAAVSKRAQRPSRKLHLGAQYRRRRRSGLRRAPSCPAHRRASASCSAPRAAGRRGRLAAKLCTRVARATARSSPSAARRRVANMWARQPSVGVGGDGRRVVQRQHQRRHAEHGDDALRARPRPGRRAAARRRQCAAPAACRSCRSTSRSRSATLMAALSSCASSRPSAQHQHQAAEQRAPAASARRARGITACLRPPAPTARSLRRAPS